METRNAFIFSGNSIPTSKWICWAVALLFTIVAVMQAYFTASSYGAKTYLDILLLFWPLNYSFWVLMLPFFYQNIDDILKSIDMGKWQPARLLAHALCISILHYIVVTGVQWGLLTYLMGTPDTGSLTAYILGYIFPSLFSHCFDYLLIISLFVSLHYFKIYRKNKQYFVHIKNRPEAVFKGVPFSRGLPDFQ